MIVIDINDQLYIVPVSLFFLWYAYNSYYNTNTYTALIINNH